MDNIHKILLLFTVLFYMVSASSFANDIYYIHANRLNIRNASDGKVIGKLQLNQTVEILGSKGGWYEINFKGTKAFVSKSFVKNRRFTKKDGLRKWGELNPDSEKTPVTLNHKECFLKLCDSFFHNGTYLHLSIDNIYSESYLCKVAGCSDTFLLTNEQILIDWSVVTKAFPGIYRVNSTSNQTRTPKTTCLT